MDQETADREFSRQARAEKKLNAAQVYECLGAQMGLADRGIQRALPVLAYEMGLLHRDEVVRLMRHVIRRCGPIQVGKFALVKYIGKGGMGIVFRGEQRSLKRTVAIKLLLRPNMDGEFVEKFKHESRISARLRHQNLVAIIDSGEADGWHFMAMEYVDGPTLTRHVAQNGPMPELHVVRMGAKLAEALHHAHENGVIHRDVKPGNVILDRDGQPKLCDLGLAQARGVDESHMIRQGLTVGSRRYMSPEQVRGIGNMDHRTDIYSLGLTLFYCLTGNAPFKSVKKEHVMAEHLRGELHWPASHDTEVSDDVSWVVMRMTAPEPSERYHSALELAHDLSGLGRHLQQRQGQAKPL